MSVAAKRPGTGQLRRLEKRWTWRVKPDDSWTVDKIEGALRRYRFSGLGGEGVKCSDITDGMEALDNMDDFFAWLTLLFPGGAVFRFVMSLLSLIGADARMKRFEEMWNDNNCGDRPL